MKIYTKGGDTGDTSLRGGTRVPKDELRIRAYGTLDELNAVLGLALTEAGVSADIQTSFLRLQAELFQLGAELATPRGRDPGEILVSGSEVSSLEKEIDSMEEKLKPLKTFILPGGSKASALVHVARTVSRRAERELVTLNRADPLRPVVLQYMNRLSDYLFVAARYLNHIQKISDTPWVPSS